MFQIQISELAQFNNESLFGSKCLTAGWGLTRTNGHRSAVLRKAITIHGSKKYFLYSETKLSVFFLPCLSPQVSQTASCPSSKRSTHICSTGQDGGICNGDSGGPLFCIQNNKE